MNIVPTNTIRSLPAHSTVSAKEIYERSLACARSGDKESARILVEQAAEMGYPDAQCALGVIYVKEGRERDAFNCFLKAAQAGHVNALNSIGSMYHIGQGCLVDYAESLKYLHEAARRGCSAASYNIGMLHLEGTGGCRKDWVEALQYFEQAVEQDPNHIEALHNAATCHMHGTTCGNPNMEKAFEYMQRAATLGDADSLLKLSVMYMHGHGCTVNPEAAFNCVRQAADQGNVDALNSLGQMYMDGYGCEESYVDGFNSFLKAAKAGDLSALAATGLMYCSGEGCAQDMNKGVRILIQAGRQGHPGVGHILQDMAERGMIRVVNGTIQILPQPTDQAPENGQDS